MAVLPCWIGVVWLLPLTNDFSVHFTMVFLDFKLNPAEERKDWIFVLDLASIHRAAEFRAKVPNHIHIVCIPAQSTSYCQPCDLAIFKSWKSVLADAASESLAESVVTGQNIKTAFVFSLMYLKRRSVMWAEQATFDIQDRTDLLKSAWEHESWETAEDFARPVARRCTSHWLRHHRRTTFDLDEEETSHSKEQVSSCWVPRMTH